MAKTKLSDELKKENIFYESLKGLLLNPILLISSLILFLFISGLSNFSFGFARTLQTSLSNTIWVIVFSVLVLAVNSFIFSGMTGVSAEYWKTGKFNSGFFSYSRKWIKVLPILALILIINSNILSYVPFYIAFFIGKAFSLSVQQAKLIFLVIYSVMLITISLFLLLIPFVMVIKNNSYLQNIKESFRLTKRKYLFLLSILVLFFVLDFLVSQMNYMIFNASLVDAINLVIILPYACLILSKLIMDK